MEVKQVIVVPSDVKMSPGKLAAQVAHAAVGAFERADGKSIAHWQEAGVTKVVLRCESQRALVDLWGASRSAGLPVFLVSDAGRTEIPPNTLTALGIGPAPDGAINKLTGSLPLY